VLDGAVVVRSPEGEQELERGELVCFAPGPDGAHKVTNRARTTARLVMFSSARRPAVAVYPDSRKIGMWPGNPDDEVMLRRAESRDRGWRERHPRLCRAGLQAPDRATLAGPMKDAR